MSEPISFRTKHIASEATEPGMPDGSDRALYYAFTTITNLTNSARDLMTLAIEESTHESGRLASLAVATRSLLEQIGWVADSGCTVLGLPRCRGGADEWFTDGPYRPTEEGSRDE